MQPAPGHPRSGRQAPKPAPTGPAGPPPRPASPARHRPARRRRGPGRSTTPGPAAWTRPAVPPAAPRPCAGACCPAPAAPGPRTDAVAGSASPCPAARRSPAGPRDYLHTAASSMAHCLGNPRGVDGVQAQRCFPQVNRDAPGDARRHQQHLPLPVRACQHALHGGRRRGEVDSRDLPVPERLPPDLDRDLQEILPLQPGPVRDQQLSGRLGGQPAFRPRPDRLREVIEARSKAGIPSGRLTTKSFSGYWRRKSRTSGS